MNSEYLWGVHHKRSVPSVSPAFADGVTDTQWDSIMQWQGVELGFEPWPRGSTTHALKHC